MPFQKVKTLLLPPLGLRSKSKLQADFAIKHKLKGLNTALLCLCAFLVLSFYTNQSFAAIRSNTGNIHFDSNNDSTNEMTLNQNGLGLGVSSPSANLHVTGNTIISETLVVGGTVNTSNSTLHINGSLAYALQSISSGSNTIVTSSIVLADTSTGDITLGLPILSESIGQQITIKRTSLLNSVFIGGGAGNIDGYITRIISPGNTTSLTLINTGTSWTILQSSAEITTEETASSNLFLWWALDETSGNTIADTSGSSRTGNLYNEHSFTGNSTTGPLGTTLIFDDYQDTAKVENLTIPTSGYTYALWSKYQYSNENVPHISPTISGNGGFVWSSSNTTFHKSAYHQLSDGTYVTTQLGRTLEANTWYHIAVTWNGGNVSLYCNGSLESGNTAASWTGASNIALKSPGGHLVPKTYADDLHVYDRALSSNEIQSLYYAGNPNP
jgi:hypothetical protein